MASSSAFAGQAQSNKFGFPSGRRASTSVAYVSPSKELPLPSTKNSPNTSTSGGIPAFRSLRSLLPFGPHKQAAPVSSNASPSPNVSRSPFTHFGSMRRSLNRERKSSFDEDLPPVISIGRFSQEETEQHTVRRSASYSRVELLNEGLANSFHKDEEIFIPPVSCAPVLPKPSSGPPLPTDLSTIIEADTSGISKYVPSTSRSPSPDPLSSNRSPLLAAHPLGSMSQNPGVDISLDLSTSHLTDEVRNAMDGSNVAKQWLDVDKAVIIDEVHASPDPDRSFNLDHIDPDLAALLSPHHGASRRRGDSLTVMPHSPVSSPPNDSSHPPNLTLTAPIPISSTGPSFLRSQLPRQQSSLPRLLPPPTHSPILLLHTPSPDPMASHTNSSYSPVKRDDDTMRIGLPRTRIQQPTPPSPLSSAAASAASSPAVISFSKASPTSAVSTPLSSSFTSQRLPSQSGSKQFTPATQAAPTTQLSSTSTFSRLRSPFMQGTHLPSQAPPLLRSTSSPDGEFARPRSSPTSSPSRSPSVFLPRPHLDPAMRGTNSLDHPRPPISPASPIHQSEFETPARPSLDTLRGIGRDAIRSGGGGSVKTGNSTSFTFLRSRKRSQSVVQNETNYSGRRASDEREQKFGEDASRSEFGASQWRSDSRLSERAGRRWDVKASGGGDGRPPVTEWLGPRTAKAFKAAGLMDFERNQQQEQHERSSPGSMSALGLAGPTSGRYTPMRSASEYNPRAPSRMAFSEAGGSSVSRRGSVSGTVTGTPYGLMESPTFTASSGSRDRDTPRSASTAPTSVSGYSSRDRDRDREDIRELKEKHATETGALLSALSDSQRTSKVLREENTELRDRLRQVEEENIALRTALDGLNEEVGDLRVQLLRTKSVAGGRLANGTWGAVTRRSGLNMSIHADDESESDDNCGGPVYGPGGEQISSKTQIYHSSNQTGRDVTGYQHHRVDSPPAVFLQAGPSSSSTPAVSKHKRRFSVTSSIFPVPPANMTMLLYDQEQDSVSLNGTSDGSQFSPTARNAALDDDRSWATNDDPNSSVMSAVNISPSTATLSMTTGSPGSLFLRPEHEVHLGDMDSLDLG